MRTPRRRAGWCFTSSLPTRRALRAHSAIYFRDDEPGKKTDLVFSLGGITSGAFTLNDYVNADNRAGDTTTAYRLNLNDSQALIVLNDFKHEFVRTTEHALRMDLEYNSLMNNCVQYITRKVVSDSSTWDSGHRALREFTSAVTRLDPMGPALTTNEGLYLLEFRPAGKRRTRPAISTRGATECSHLLVVSTATPMTIKKKVGLTLLCATLALVLYALVFSAYRLWKLRESMCAKISEARMQELMTELRIYQPERPDGESFRRVLAKEGRLDALKDGWSRPLVIERTVNDGRSHYTIISLGRDGRRGPCCKPNVYSWDDDAVLSGDELSGNKWLQVWSAPRLMSDN